MVHFENVLQFCDGIVYFKGTQSLHNFRIPECHVIRRPIPFDLIDDELTMFNIQENTYSMEITCACGCFYSTTTDDPWITEKFILFKD